jgi:hypothetical protein
MSIVRRDILMWTMHWGSNSKIELKKKEPAEFSLLCRWIGWLMVFGVRRHVVNVHPIFVFRPVGFGSFRWAVSNNFLHFLQPQRLQDFHWRIFTSYAPCTSSLFVLALSSFPGMKVHSTQVAGRVVTFIIPLARGAGLAVGQEAFVWRRVDGDPNLSDLLVDSVSVAAELMFAAEAVGIVVALITLKLDMSRPDILNWLDLAAARLRVVRC